MEKQDQGPSTPELIDRFNAPFNRSVKLESYQFDNGFPMLKLMIREGKRFTTMELDPDTARHWGEVMLRWAEEHALEQDN